MESCAPIALPSSPIRPPAGRPPRARAPRGGIVVDGRRYRGGVFIPAPAPVPAPANPRDSWPAWTDGARWTTGAPGPAPAAIVGAAVPAPDLGPFAPAKFSIDGFRYLATRVPAGECGSVAYEVHRPDTNHTYRVLRDGSGEFTCTCPDSEMRRAGTGRPCKHARKLIDLKLIPAPPTRPASRSDSPAPATISRPRRFVPTPEEMCEAAAILADLAAV